MPFPPRLAVCFRKRIDITVAYWFFALALGACSGAFAGEVSAVRLWSADDHTRAVLDVSENVEYKIFALDAPPRLVLDVKGSSKQVLTAEPRGVITGLRSGTPNPGQLRIVFDLAGKVRPKSFLLPPTDRFQHRLVLDLYPEDAGSVPVRTVKREPASATGRNVIIAIDAGHGGDDPGAIGPTGTFEKTVTLKIALALAEKINAEAGMEAVLTRDSDFYVPLEERFEKSRIKKADLFISIHADAFNIASVNGSSVFVLSQRGATNEAARYLADRENRADLVGGVSLDDKDATLAAVLLDLSQGATAEASANAADRVLKALARVGKTHKRYVERANFVVLRSPDVPSMLIETGFISNPREEKNLNSADYRGRLADAILDGVRDFFYAAPIPGTWVAQHARTKRHTVARGETLSDIALKHRVSVLRIRAVNGLRSDTVRVGAVLKIPGG
jgi:N-acetylmuramoyl-L-alanine amidase